MMAFVGAPEKQKGLNTGVIWQDHHHQTLFDRFQKLEIALSEGNLAEVGNLLEFIYHFGKEHFALEELYMAETQFAHFDEHKKAHEMFLKTMGILTHHLAAGGNLQNLDEVLPEDLAIGTMESPKDLIEILQFWLLHHIQKQDAQLAQHLKSA